MFEIEELTLNDKLGMELRSSNENVLSCESSEVVEESSSKETKEESKKEESGKERGNHLMCNNLLLLCLKFHLCCYDKFCLGNGS